MFLRVGDITGRPINTGNFATHQTNVSTQLSAVMYRIKQSDPQKTTYCTGQTRIAWRDSLSSRCFITHVFLLILSFFKEALRLDSRLKAEST